MVDDGNPGKTSRENDDGTTLISIICERRFQWWSYTSCEGSYVMKRKTERNRWSISRINRPRISCLVHGLPTLILSPTERL